MTETCANRHDGKPKKQTIPPNGGQRRGILVVDDEPAIRDSLQTLLQHEGFRVWTASCSEEAFDQCCDHGEEVAVVLLDVQMPGLEGPRTLEGIRQFDADIPVCFIAADPGDHELGDLVRQGGRHLFRKPFCMDEIVRVVRNLASEPLRRLRET
jgi:two-component system, OmpR family, response regulator MprA